MGRREMGENAYVASKTGQDLVEVSTVIAESEQRVAEKFHQCGLAKYD